ncbi:MAG: methionine--tRNA ligase [Kofleriaceae bacterium]
MTTSFVTTAIPYVNASPHLGFAYELVLGDVLARHHRRRGRDVWFATGTDEHSLKNVAAAARAGVPVRELVDRNAAAFRALETTLGLAPDDFVRTASDPRHRATVEALWQACAADLVRARWTGRYCAGCESFVEADVAICEEHGTVPELVSETNWFFQLARYVEPLRAAIESGRLVIVPEAARTETLRFLAGPVHDLSVSRDAARAAGWGIPVPGDPTQVIYVWFDALASYLAAAGESRWRASERTHVIGKDITRFHAVYWPAFLLAAGLPLPDRILVHGYLTVDGKKIAKSGTGFEVPPVVDQFGVDAVRWYFVRRCRTRGDSDVKLAEIAAAHDGDLADRLGNLVQRCGKLVERLGVPIPVVVESPLRGLAEALPAKVDAALAAFLPDDAAAAILDLVDAANRTLAQTAPWQVADPQAAAALLYAPLEAARIATAELSVFVPGIAATVLDRLGGAGLAPAWGHLPAIPWRPGPPPLPKIARSTDTASPPRNATNRNRKQ